MSVYDHPSYRPPHPSFQDPDPQLTQRLCNLSEQVAQDMRREFREGMSANGASILSENLSPNQLKAAAEALSRTPPDMRVAAMMWGIAHENAMQARIRQDPYFRTKLEPQPTIPEFEGRRPDWVSREHPNLRYDSTTGPQVQPHRGRNDAYRTIICIAYERPADIRTPFLKAVDLKGVSLNPETVKIATPQPQLASKPQFEPPKPQLSPPPPQLSPNTTHISLGGPGGIGHV